MIRRLGPLLRLELVRMTRSRSELFTYVVVPMLWALGILGVPTLMVKGAAPARITVHATNLREAGWLASFLRANKVRLVADPDPRRSLIVGKASVGLVIPRHLDQRLRAGSPASVSVLYLQGEGASRTRAVALGELLERFRVRQLAKVIQSLGGDPAGARIFDVRAEAAEASSAGRRLRLAQLLPFLLMMSLSSNIAPSAMTFLRLREARTVEALLSMPYRPGELMAGLSFAWLLRAGISLGSTWSALVLIRALPQFEKVMPPPDPGVLVVDILLFLPVVFLFIATGLILSILSPSFQYASGATSLLFLVMAGVAFAFHENPPTFSAVALLPLVGQLSAAYEFTRAGSLRLTGGLGSAASCLALAAVLFRVGARQLVRVPLVLRTKRE